MKLKFNIGGKLWVGFGLLLGSIFITSVVTYFTLVKTSRLNNEIHEVSSPSLMYLKELRSLLAQSEKLISVWISNENDDIPQKSQLSKMHSEDFPIVLKSLKQISKSWDVKDKVLIDTLLHGVDSLLRHQHNIMLKYDEKEAYHTDEASMELPILGVMYNSGDKFEQMNALLYEAEKIIYSLESNSLTLRDEINRLFRLLQNYALYLGILFFVSGFIVAFFIIASIVDPIHKLRDLLQTMGQGVLPTVQLEDRKDEIGQINRALINLISGLKSIVSFSKSIGNGDFEVNFKPLSSNDDLGNNLLLMKNNLRKVADDDNKRNWTTGGLAKFSELLRVSSDNVLKLTDNLITELVHYTGANQGSIFVINDSDPNIQFLEMKACFAWERQKFIDQKIYIGEGLVGQSWQERDTIYITDVPDNYIKITSGLGKALPKSILIVPMVANDTVFGVMEIASFKLFEKYEIDFVEHLAASTATTISSARVNERTKKLLEQAQYSSEQLKIHEEEVRKQQAEINKKQENQELEIGLLKKQVTELSFKNTHLKDENEVLQNLILKFKKEIDSE
jgi:hypothetical protein